MDAHTIVTTAKYTFDGPTKACNADGKHVYAGPGNSPVNHCTKNLPEGVCGQDLEKLETTPTALADLLSSKGATSL